MLQQSGRRPCAVLCWLVLLCLIYYNLYTITHEVKCPATHHLNLAGTECMPPPGW